MSKGCLGINDGLLKGQALALMNGDGPGKLQRVLLEFADDLLIDFPAFFVKGVFDIFPVDWPNLDCFGVIGANNIDFLAGNSVYSADFAVVIKLVGGGIIAHKHHLCSLFKQKTSRSRVDVFRKISGNFSPETVFFFG